MKLILILLFELVFTIFISSQVLWQKDLHFGQNDAFQDAIQLKDCGYAMLGNQWTFPPTVVTKTTFVKLNELGEVTCAKSYLIGHGYHSINRLKLFELENGFMILGEAWEVFNNKSLSDIFWLKVNSNGDRIFIKTAKEDNESDIGDEIVGANQLPTGEIIWVQQKMPWYNNSTRLYLRKINLNGDILSSVLIDQSDSIDYRSMTIANDNSILVLGSTHRSFIINNNVRSILCVLKTDINGNIKWKKYYGNTGRNIAYDIVQSNDGSYQVVGSTNEFSPAGILSMQIDSNGAIINSCSFEHWLGGKVIARATEKEIFAVPSKEGLNLCTSSNEDDLLSHFQVFKLTSDCKLISRDTFTHINSNILCAAPKLDESRFVLLGSSFLSTHSAYALMIGDSIRDCVTKNDCITGVNDFKSEISFYPNPTSGQFFLNMSSDLYGTSSLLLYNGMGQVIREWSIFDNYQYSLEGINPGVYFWRVNFANGITFLGKLVVSN